MLIKKLVSTSMLFMATFGLFSLSPAHAQSAFIDVDVGGGIICGIRDDNKAICTSTATVEGLPPADLPPVLAISSTIYAACAILVSGDLRCWGRDDGYGLLSPPTSGAPYKAIGTNNTHSCAINRDDAIECWGLSSNGRLDAPAGAFQQLSVSSSQACALDINGTVSCWGQNDSGLNIVPADLPVAQKVISSIASSCALLLDGSIQCWGRTLPAPSSGPYVDVAAAAFGTTTSGSAGVCGIDTNGKLDCAQLMYNAGVITPLDFYSPQTPVPTTFGNSSISMNSPVDACFITSAGVIDCFGFRAADTIPQLAGTTVPDTTGLRSETYSDTAVELFWDAPDFSVHTASFEIQRNGEVIAITQNGSSYFIDDIVPGELTTFAVRRLSSLGNVGPFSNSIEVLTGSGITIGLDTGSVYVPPARPLETTGLDALVYGSNALELVWDRASDSAVDGYEIRRDGVFVSFSSGTSYFDDTVSADRVYRYDVIAVSRGDSPQIYGMSSVGVSTSGIEPGMCL